MRTPTAIVRLSSSWCAAPTCLICNYRPGVAEKLGIGYPEVSALNGTIVYCSISGFGGAEDVGGLKAYESVVMAKVGKMVGLDVLSGAGERNLGDRPIYSAAAVASYAAGQLAFQGTLAALLNRERVGRSQLVETSLLQGIMAGTMRLPLRRERSEATKPRSTGNALGATPGDRAHIPDGGMQ